MGEGMGEYVRGQGRAALAGGVSYNPDTGQVDRFDTTVVMGGGNPATTGGTVLGSGMRAGRAGKGRAFEQYGGNLEEARNNLNITEEGRKAWQATRSGFKQQRPEELRIAAQKVSDGEMTFDEYRALVQEVLPPEPLGQLMEVPSLEQIALSLDKNPEKTAGIIGLNIDLPDGTPASSRLDINAYENQGTWVNTIHEGGKSSGTVLGYGPTTVLNNVSFNSNPKQALEIAMGKSKTPIGRIDGTWENRDPNVVVEQVRSILDGTAPDAGDWVEVGMNPIRGSGFYNKETFELVGESDQILQVGPVVLAKKPTYIQPNDPRNMVMDRGQPRLDRSGNPVFFGGGGRTGTGIAAGSALRESFRIGDQGFDARFDDRALEQDRIQNTELQYDVRPFERPDVSIYDLEGKPFRLTMSDRTAAGRDLTGVEGVEYDIPINLQGGQDFMFANPLGREGQVWAQDKGATSKYLNSFLGLDGQPMGDEFLMLPFRMSPAGGDFATMTGEVMVTHARNNVPARAKRQADERIRQFYPAWKGIDNPESLQQISEMKGDPRKALLNVMDKDLRNEGGLGIGQARLAVSDRSQYNALDTGLQNVGIATPNIVSVNRRGRPILERFEDSGHRTYEQGLAGRPMGTLIEQDISAYELLPDYLVGRGFRNFEDLMASDPSVLATEAFTLRRGTRGGTITEDMLRDIERRRSQ